MKAVIQVIIFGAIGMAGWHLWIKLVDRLLDSWDRKDRPRGTWGWGNPLTPAEQEVLDDLERDLMQDAVPSDWDPCIVLDPWTPENPKPPKPRRGETP